MEAFSEFPEVHPAWLVGRREAPAGEFAARWSFDHYTLDLQEALADPEVDAVIITSPNQLHAEQTERSLKAGKHVLCEIPLALNLGDARRVTRLSREEGRHLMVAHTMRTFPAIRELRRRVESGELHVEHFVGEFMMARRKNVTADGKPRSWTDNVLWHHGAHMVDAMLWITRNTTADVFCRFGPEHPTQGVMNLSMSLLLPGGTVGTLAQSYGSYQFRWRLDVFAREDTLSFSMGELRDSKGEIVVPQRSIVDLREQNREFVQAILEHRDPAVTGEDVLPTMKILHDAQACADSLSSEP